MTNTIGILPSEYGNTPIKRLVNFYGKLFYKRYGFYPRVSYPIIGKLYKSLLNDFTEYQIGLFLLVHFEWRGTDGTDNFLHKKLSDNTFPMEWLPKSVNAYQAYIRNTLNVGFDDLTEVKKYVDECCRVFK